MVRRLVEGLLLVLLVTCDMAGGDDGGSFPYAEDTTPPQLEVLGDNPLALFLGDEFQDPGARAVDDRDGEVPVQDSGEVDVCQVGGYTIVYTASDKSGNVARAERRVVAETVSGLTCPPDTLTVDGDLATKGYEGATDTPRPDVVGAWLWLLRCF